MKTKMREMLVMWLLALLIAACASPAVPPGGVEQLQPATTAAGIARAVAGEADTLILQNGSGLRLYVWPQSGGWGFACIKDVPGCDPAALVRYLGGKGNWVPAAEMSYLVKSLTQAGWERVTVAASGVVEVMHMVGQSVVPLIGIMVIPAPSLESLQGPQG